MNKIEKRPNTIDVDKKSYEAQLDFIIEIRSAEKESTDLAELEERVVKAILALDEALK